MNVTKIIMARRACQFENNDPRTGNVTAVKWSVIFESEGLFFQIDEIRTATQPQLADVRRHVEAHPELIKPTIVTSGPKGEGFTFH